MHCLLDGMDVSRFMVLSGFARDYTHYSGGFYEADERVAKLESQGIWKKSNESP